MTLSSFVGLTFLVPLVICRTPEEFLIANERDWTMLTNREVALEQRHPARSDLSGS